MRIGIDVRMAGTEHGGIGRYVLELTKHLLKLDNKNEYFLFYNDSSLDEIENLKSKTLNLKCVRVNIRHYTLREQIFFPFILKKYKLDLVHFPNFNAPILYQSPFVVTIHDLIHHKLGGVKKTNFLHFFAYKKIIKHAILNCKQVITVSNASKEDILNAYKIEKEKITVIYEGTSLAVQVTQKSIAEVKAKFYLNKNYFVFTGVMQRNKNLPSLCKSFDLFLEKYKHNFDLVIVGKEDPHYPDIKNECVNIKHRQNLVFTGYLDDNDLSAIYAGAYAFVSASLYEGFGLPGLEATRFGLPLAVSNIPVFNEIYENAAIYFDPNDQENIAECMNLLAQDRLYYMQIKQKALERAKKFDWENCAKETLRVYKQAIKL